MLDLLVSWAWNWSWEGGRGPVRKNKINTFLDKDFIFISLLVVLIDIVLFCIYREEIHEKER